MLMHNYRKQLNKTNNKYTDMFQQSDGSKLHKASDNSFDYSRYLRYQNSLDATEQYINNTNTALSWMKNSDAALTSVSDLLTTFKGKMVQAGNSTNTEVDSKAIAKELLTEVQEIVVDMNAMLGDRYLFSGQADTTEPFHISKDREPRGDTKTLDENQAAFFGPVQFDADGNVVADSFEGNVGTGRVFSQMLKLTDDNGDVYYMTVQGDVYTKEFVENGYKDKVKLENSDKWGSATSFSVNDYFDEYGVLKDAAKTTINVNGKALKFSTTMQYIVRYNGDDKHISMVKKSGGIDAATDTVNLSGQDVFGSDIFDTGNAVYSGAAVLNNLLNAVAQVENHDYIWASNDGLTIADAANAAVSEGQTWLGARQQAYTSAKTMLTSQTEYITSDIADVASTDVSVLATKLMELQTLYQLSLSVGSKVLPSTLADYL